MEYKKKTMPPPSGGLTAAGGCGIITPTWKERRKRHEAEPRDDAHDDVHVPHAHALPCSSFDGLSDRRLTVARLRAGVGPPDEGASSRGSLFFLFPGERRMFDEGRSPAHGAPQPGKQANVTALTVPPYA